MRKAHAQRKITPYLGLKWTNGAEGLTSRDAV